MSNDRIWCVIPAAGTGRRMGSEVPKQYLGLAGRKVIEHTLERFLDHPRIAGVTVALAPGDAWWDGVSFSASRAPRRCDGGRERFESVLNGLDALLAEGAGESDWVLVHDAVRPCVRTQDIDRLIDAAGNHPVGGVLGMPARDTMKRADADGVIDETVDRSGLWHAFTPQMFRIGPLGKALRRAVDERWSVTDEAQAMERSGACGLMVEGHGDNLKITTPGDLALAEQILRVREESS